LDATKSFQCADTKRLFNDEDVPRFVNIRQPARQKLLMLHATKRLTDLKAPRATGFIRSRETAKDNTDQHQ